MLMLRVRKSIFVGNISSNKRLEGLILRKIKSICIIHALNRLRLFDKHIESINATSFQRKNSKKNFFTSIFKFEKAYHSKKKKNTKKNLFANLRSTKNIFSKNKKSVVSEYVLLTNVDKHKTCLTYEQIIIILGFNSHIHCRWDTIGDKYVSLMLISL